MAPLIIQLVENQSWIQNNQKIPSGREQILSSIEVPVKVRLVTVSLVKSFLF